jgi:hypothetical protein
MRLPVLGGIISPAPDTMHILEVRKAICREEFSKKICGDAAGAAGEVG